MIGFDYTERIDPAALKAAGCSVVFRYTTWSGWAKSLAPGEADELHAAGIPIAANFESTADRMRGGAAAGRADALEARGHLSDDHLPADLKIWFSADWDVQPSEVPLVLAYLGAASDVLGGVQKVGCYGGLRAVKAAADAGFAIWQTVAWSGGVRDPRAAALQTGAEQTVGGVVVDVNEINDLAALGAWGGPNAGGDVALAPEDIQAIAAAVNAYRDTNNEITIGGKPYAASSYELAVGTWKAVNDPAGGLEQTRGQVNNLFHRPVFDAGAFAAAVTPVIQAAVAAGLPADEIAQKIAEAVPGHIELTVSAK